MLSKQIANFNSSDNKPRILSLFSGCGGLDLGFHQAGYETVWANDFSHWACEVSVKYRRCHRRRRY